MNQSIDGTIVRREPSSRLARLAGALALLAVAACSTTPPPTPASAPPPTYTETGIASWYGAEHAGAKTASGAPFDPAKATAAHRSLPLRTVARVTNTENGRSVTVVINDRGPFAKGRIIDVSATAAQVLGIKQDGIALVRVEVMEEDQAEAHGIAAR